MKTRKIVTWIIVGAIALSFTGTGIYFLVKLIKDQTAEVDYSKLKDYELEDDQEQLMTRYNSTQEDDLSKVFNTCELANISINKFKEHKYYYSKTYGNASAVGINQTIRASVIKYGNNYFMENISSGLISTAKRFYQNGEIVKTYNGNNIQVERAHWDESSLEELSLVEHYEKWGKDLSRPLIYIISSKTVLNTSTTEVTQSGYVVHLDLSPEYSILRYIRQMVSISNVKNPIFESVHLDLTIDKDMNLAKMEVSESYSVVKVFRVNTTASLEETYTYDQKTKIPSLNENVNY